MPRCWSQVFSLLALLPLCLQAEIDRSLKLAVYQGPCQDGSFSVNLAVAEGIVSQARRQGADFLLFPEAFLSGYDTPEHVKEGARPLDDSELTTFVLQTADHEMVVIIGLARQDGDDLFNSALVIHRGSIVGHYDKIMLTPGDRDVLGFRAGQSVPVFAAHGVRFGIAICHDTSFPHVALSARLQGAQLLFTPHYNSIAREAVDDHRRWVRHCHIGLATQCKMVVARSNIVTTRHPDQVGYGDSYILSPQGEPLAQADLFRTELITARIDAQLFESPTVWADLNETPTWLRRHLSDLLAEFRLPSSESELTAWLENMVRYHRYTPGEISQATGLPLHQVESALHRLHLRTPPPPRHPAGGTLVVQPYPGGRHPRAGFLEGAVMPQRETKFSVFTPWDDTSYVVVDLPEALWSSLGLTYLAHTHIPTLWSSQGITLPRLEWNRQADGSLSHERTLPNGIAFGARVQPTPTEVRMTLWVRNGTAEELTGLRAQNCVHLPRANGFNRHTLSNKVFQPPFAAVGGPDNTWIITAWIPNDRCWGNEAVPCLHADPSLPDCPPGETVEARGWLSFFQGSDVLTELARIRDTEYFKTFHAP